MQSRDAFDGVGAEGRVAERCFGAGGADEGGRDGIDVNVVLTPFDSQAFRQVRDGRLRHAVNGFRRQRHKARLGAHVHNAAVFLANHDAAGRLAGEKRPLQIHCQRAVEVLLAHVFGQVFRGDAGIVHQDIQPSEMPGGVFNRRKYLFEARHVHLKA